MQKVLAVEYPHDLLLKLPPDQPQLKLLCYMMSMGMPVKDIATVTNLSPSTVGHLLEMPSVQLVLTEIQAHLFGNSTVHRFAQMVPKAMDKLERLIEHSDKDSTALRAIEVVLDRSLGKVAQTVNVEQTSTLKLLLEKVQANASPLSDDAPLQLPAEQIDAVAAHQAATLAAVIQDVSHSSVDTESSPVNLEEEDSHGG